MTNCEVSIGYDSFSRPTSARRKTPWNTCQVDISPPAAYDGLAGGVKYLVHKCLRPEYKRAVTTWTCMQDGSPEVKPMGA